MQVVEDSGDNDTHLRDTLFHSFEKDTRPEICAEFKINGLRNLIKEHCATVNIVKIVKSNYCRRGSCKVGVDEWH